MSGFRSISSLTTQRYLERSTSTLARASEKLSSGLRINSASDDAAGLSISSTLKNSAKLYSTASRNINDGMSALIIMQSALESQNQIIMRLQELATQSANGVLTYKQRYNLNNEYQELLKEHGRIGDTTKFNNLELLRGGRLNNISSLAIQAGVSGSSTSQVSINLTDSGALSGIVNAESGLTYADPASDTAYTTEELEQFGAAMLRVQITNSSGATTNAIVVLQPSSGSLNFAVFVRGDNSNGATTTDPEKWVATGVLASMTYDTTTGKINGSGVGTLSFSDLAAGATATTSLNLSGVIINTTSSASNYNNISLTGIETQTQATKSLTVLSQRLSDSSLEIGKIGATQSRLSIASNVVNTLRDNTIAANSRIEDVDVAEESANYIAAQIKQNTAAFILAQANAQPDYLLNLLR